MRTRKFIYFKLLLLVYLNINYPCPEYFISIFLDQITWSYGLRVFLKMTCFESSFSENSECAFGDNNRFENTISLEN